ncbi:hypothetical protein CcrC1_gp230c [Caulobacter phage C1]|nr:hypothetical protein CcrC1_gp230c [Caulobacter phage C1]UTU08459.1 hypothetical protein CcrC2_gp231c [Caulobacter phage C2]UTU08976.1 hypothetical protein CcrJ4_gp225c [Caulobacter phage J4]UTU10092.1 hypothetical protein CcrRB23_gp230c [Caulobacter phage RB23]WGN97127.1 hypothetical protein [Bertelyvirus sp.]
MPYQRKPVLVEAFQWDRSADRTSWPAWAQTFEGLSSIGMSPIGTSGVGTLLVPSKNTTAQAVDGDWIVLLGKHEAAVFSPAAFAEQFEEVGEAVVPLSNGASVPVETTAPETEKPTPAKSRTAKAETAPAPETPAGDDA